MPRHRLDEGARVSRDDRPVLEFSLPWQVYAETTDANLLEIFRFSSAETPLSLDALAPEQREEIEKARAALGFDQVALALRMVKHDDQMEPFFEQALELNPDDALARQGLGR